MKPEEMPESFFAGLRAQLHDIYRNADLVAGYLVNREYRSRGPLPSYDGISVADVRMEPQASWVDVYYTLWYNGHRSRECIPIMWDLFRKIVDSENTGKSRKDPFSCLDKRTPAPDEYIPRPIPRHEYDMVCEASQHFTETYKHYCDRIHAQERAEYLHLKNFPDENEVVPSVEQGLDGFPTVVYFSVARHYLGNRKCTRTYRPSHLDKNAIAEIGEEAFRKLVSKYAGKETQDL